MGVRLWMGELTKDTPGGIVETDLPSRLDRLPWGPFHTLVVIALGVTWILDGLEVTLAGSVAGALKESPVFDAGRFKGLLRERIEEIRQVLLNVVDR